MGLVKMTGIVLSSGNVGEYDKRVVILTKERGKITAFARGARKMGSPYTAACQSFAFGEFSVFEGKNYNLNGVEIKEYFSELKEDLETLYLALYFCEMADYFTVEGNDELATMQLLYVTLQALKRKEMDARLIRRVYECRLLAGFGLMMETFHCVSCGRTPTKEEMQKELPILTHFNSRKGGVICSDCAKQLLGNITLSNTTVYTLQYIVTTPFTKLYHFQVKEPVLLQLEKVMKDYMAVYASHHFKSLEFLELKI